MDKLVDSFNPGWYKYNSELSQIKIEKKFVNFYGKEMQPNNVAVIFHAELNAAERLYLFIHLSVPSARSDIIRCTYL